MTPQFSHRKYSRLKGSCILKGFDLAFTILTQLILFIILGCMPVSAQTTNLTSSSPEVTEYAMKAAQIYILAAYFVEWPTDAFESEDSPFIFTVLGDNPFGSILEDTFQNKTIKNRKILIQTNDQLNDLERCHILFISKSEREILDDILEKIQNWPMLTVSDTTGFAKQGVIINFFMVNNKIRFKINIDATRRANLKISSQVLELKLVEIIHDNREGSHVEF